MRLLVVDAVEHARQSLTSFLDLQPGLQIVGTADNDDGALSVAEATHPDLVIMDVNIPNGDGFAVTRRLTRLSTPPAVILLAVHLDAETRRLATEAGAFECVETSAGIDRLISAIRTVAADRRAR